MKKRIIGAAIAAIVLMALVAACAPEVQDVSIVDDYQAAQVAKVEAAQKGDNYYVIVSWDAAKNGTGYGLYAQPDGKKTVINLWDAGNVWTSNDWNWVINPQDPDNLWKEPEIDWSDKNKNTDVDKWSAFIKIKHTRTKYADDPDDKETTTVGTLAPGKYRFGVKTFDGSPKNSDSEIKWSAPFDIAAPAGKADNDDPWGYEFHEW